jgi:hypothetical protein
VRQTLDYYHLSEHLYAFANLHYPNNPTGANGRDAAMRRNNSRGPGISVTHFGPGSFLLE